MLPAILKGWLGEKLTQVTMFAHLDGRLYRRFHGLIVPSPSGTTQVDHVIVSVFGVFVVETKCYRGVIHGAERDAEWTVRNFFRVYPFQNPLRQNYRHIRCLAEYLGLPAACFRSVVIFQGGARLNTHLPNVLTSGLARYIRSFDARVLSLHECSLAIDALQAVANDPSMTNDTHMKSLRARLANQQTCPRCGVGTLRVRAVRLGARAGRSYLACSNFSSCQHTESIPQLGGGGATRGGARAL
jgi:hypothetical protein